MSLEQQVLDLHRSAAVTAFKEAKQSYGKLEVIQGYEADYPHTTLSVAQYLNIDGDSEQRKRLNASKLALPWFTMPGLKGKRVFHSDLLKWLKKSQIQTLTQQPISELTAEIPNHIKVLLGEA